MERINRITNKKGQTLEIVDDVREIWSNPLNPYSMYGAKLVGYTVVTHSQTINGEPASDKRVAQFTIRAQEQMDKIREREEREQLARLKEKYEEA